MNDLQLQTLDGTKLCQKTDLKKNLRIEQELLHLPSKTYTTIGIISLLVTWLAGAIQFGTISFLSHTMDTALFSQVSIVLNSLAIFYVLIEMGIQPELIRRLANHKSSDLFVSCLCLRLFMSLLAIGFSAAFSYLSHLGHETSMGLFFYSLSYLPLSMIQCLEELGYAKRNLLLTCLNRGTRILAFSIFLVLSYLASSETNLNFSYNFFLIFPLFFSLAAVFGFKKIGFLNIQNNFPKAALRNLCKETSHLALASGVRFGTIFLYTAYLTASLGEANLASYQVSLVLMAPLSILIQVLSNIASAKMVNSQKKNLAKTLIFVMAPVSLATIFFMVTFSFTPVTLLFFPGIDHSIFLNLFVPMCLAQVFIAGTTIINIELMRSEKKHYVVWGSLINGTTLFIASMAMNYQIFRLYYTIPIFIASAISFIALYLATPAWGLAKHSDKISS